MRRMVFPLSVLVVMTVSVGAAGAQTAEVIHAGSPFSGGLVGLAVSPDDTTLRVAEFTQGQIYRMPATGGTAVRIKTSSVGGSRGLGVSQEGGTLYVAGWARSGVFSLPTSGGPSTVFYSGSPLTYPLGLSLSPDGTTLFIADKLGNGVYSMLVFTVWA